MSVAETIYVGIQFISKFDSRASAIIVTTALSKVYRFRFDSETEQLVSTDITLPDVVFVRQLPNRSALIAGI